MVSYNQPISENDYVSMILHCFQTQNAPCTIMIMTAE